MENTTTISEELALIIKKDFYVPTVEDCKEAGLINISSDTHFFFKTPDPSGEFFYVRNECVIFSRMGTDPVLAVDVDGEDVTQRELVFADRNSALAFFRNHYATMEGQN